MSRHPAHILAALAVLKAKVTPVRSSDRLAGIAISETAHLSAEDFGEFQLMAS